jgi:murein DD-endopeptidase MepM/ murein hydrolase activator NlpD
MSPRHVRHHIAADRTDSAELDQFADPVSRPTGAQPHPHEHRTTGSRGGHGARTGRRFAASSAFTFGHGSRQVRIGPVAFWTVVGTLVIMAGWSVMTATYFAFQDDVLARMMARQADMQFAYEDRLAEMRAQVDRVTSRQLLDQEQLEQKLEQVVRRQAILESRAATLNSVADPATTGSLRQSARPTAPVAGAAPKPSPLSGPPLFAPASLREARATANTNGLVNPDRAVKLRANLPAVLTRLAESLDHIEGRQTNALATLEEKYTAKARRLRAMLADVGVDPAKAIVQGVGGPFVPYRLPANAGAFERQVYRISVVRADAERLANSLGTVPLRKPVEGEIDQSSGFGVRIDPFIGRPAMHTGLDFRGDTGEPIKVTAGGTVVSAGWSGGYGRMVEVDHGNGLATRYGHMSEIEVHVGQIVKAGQTVGRLGSSGRSTGPHLHYETRIEGEAVDPTRFLQAGAKYGVM